MGRWQEIDHTADLALHIWADDLRDLFVTAARGMFSLIVPLDAIKPEHEATIELEALDVETLLVDWLNELLYLVEVQDIAFALVEIERVSATRLRATVCGCAVPEYLNYVKAATFHNLAVVETSEGYETEIVFDT